MRAMRNDFSEADFRDSGIYIAANRKLIDVDIRLFQTRKTSFAGKGSLVNARDR